jgi:ATP-dependent DNA helicase RecQ
MSGIAFFDLEVSLTSQKIGSIGGVWEGQTWHSASVHDFALFAQEAQVLCGHNIFAHDLPVLQKAGISAAFLQKEFMDTLYLSPLLFPNRPYHRLVKDYRLVSDYLNDPVADARLAQGQLADCLEA